jgi:hypothetical protein
MIQSYDSMIQSYDSMIQMELRSELLSDWVIESYDWIIES